MADAGMIYALTAKTLAAGADITGTHINSDLIQFVASQVSATADLIEASASTPTPGHVAILLAQKGVGFANLAQNQLVKCGGNLLALGIDSGLVVVEAPTGVGAAVAALEIVADLYSTRVDCSPILDQATKPVHEAFTDWYTRIVWDIYQLYGIPVTGTK
jgi:hypothetical protein